VAATILERRMKLTVRPPGDAKVVIATAMIVALAAATVGCTKAASCRPGTLLIEMACAGAATPGGADSAELVLTEGGFAAAPAVVALRCPVTRYEVAISDYAAGRTIGGTLALKAAGRLVASISLDGRPALGPSCTTWRVDLPSGGQDGGGDAADDRGASGGGGGGGSGGRDGGVGGGGGSDGSATIDASCNGGDGSCGSDAMTPRVCNQAQTRCATGSTTLVESCDAAGQWGAPTACPYVCDAALNRCGGECPPGMRQCSAGAARVCGDNGRWGGDTTCTSGCNTATGVCNDCVDEAMSATCSAGRCGAVTNNCGRMVSCLVQCVGTGQTCGGGGTPGRCGCLPRTAAAACGAQMCGTAADGCGATVGCGPMDGACPQPPSNGTASCNGTSCVVTCASGYHVCGTSCLSNASASSCGNRCEPCPAPAGGSAICEGAQTCAIRCELYYFRQGDG
jgi:hypothetical protein